jgi:HNH endonuclease
MRHESSDRPGAWYVCEQCGVLFPLPPHHPATARGKFCDRVCLAASRRIPLRERFAAFVVVPDDPDACRDWSGAKAPKGYGLIGSTADGGERWIASRFSWVLHHGSIPEGLSVLHRCDNPPCCNPRHLYLGTIPENNADMHRKGRGYVPPRRSGEGHPRARLTESLVRELRRHYAAGKGSHVLSREYNLPHTTVHHVLKGHTWKHLIGPEGVAALDAAPAVQHHLED